MKKALITGITGQDGSYLAELLLEKGYEVHGLVRWSSAERFERILPILDRIHIHQADLLDQLSLINLLEKAQPDEVYNLAAQSFVPLSWAQPVSTAEITAVGVTRVLEAIRLVNRKIKFYQASSSELFGRARQTPQSESTPFYPLSPYGVAKLYAHWITVNYRDSFGLFACCGILFNHESPRRSREFVTRKVTSAAARISLGLQDKLHLGNLSSKRDWGYAGDYVKAIWSMLQQPEPGDYVIATGVQHSVRDLVAYAFDKVGLDWEKHVVLDPVLLRPVEVENLVGDASKAHRVLGWKPEITFEGLINMMVDHDLKANAK